MKRFLILAFLLVAQPAFANHPGERIDEVMTEQEPAFEVMDRASTPDLDVEEPGGNVLRLGDLHDQIVVLSFVSSACGGPCVEQQAVLAGVQEQVNVSPMKQMVTFVTVHDAEASIEATWDKANWRLVIPSSDETTAAAANRFSASSGHDQELPMAHVIDRNGRHAGIFHGSDFSKTNLTLYINGLINNVHAQKPPTEKSWWQRLTDWFGMAGETY